MEQKKTVLGWAINLANQVIILPTGQKNNITTKLDAITNKVYHCPKRSIVPGYRWNVLPPGTLTRLTLKARKGLKPPLE